MVNDTKLFLFMEIEIVNIRININIYFLIAYVIMPK